MRLRIGRRALIAVLLLPGAGCFSPGEGLVSPCWALEKSMLFFPRHYPDGDWNTRKVPVEDAWFVTADGVRLHGWFYEAENPRAVLLYAHGNGGNVTNSLEALRFFPEVFHTSILVFDYRGYGRSEGTPTEAGLLADARAARRWLAGRTKVAEADIVLLGRSLGGGVMVDLAARDGARGLVLENTYTSLPDVADSHFPMLLPRLLMRTRLDSIAKIRDYHGPLLQTHGEADRVIPFELGTKLYAAANEPKQFVRVPGGDHNDPPTREYLVALDRFLDLKQARFPTPAGHPNVRRTEGTATSLLHTAVGFSST